jgi:hypothetical protein
LENKVTRFGIKTGGGKIWQREYSAALRPLERIAPHVFLTAVDDTFYLKPLMRYNVKQERPKLRHAYGTIQVKQRRRPARACAPPTAPTVDTGGRAEQQHGFN